MSFHSHKDVKDITRLHVSFMFRFLLVIRSISAYLKVRRRMHCEAGTPRFAHEKSKGRNCDHHENCEAILLNFAFTTELFLQILTRRSLIEIWSHDSERRSYGVHRTSGNYQISMLSNQGVQLNRSCNLSYRLRNAFVSKNGKNQVWKFYYTVDYSITQCTVILCSGHN